MGSWRGCLGALPLAFALAAPGEAAMPTSQAVVAVSVTVVPACDSTACRSAPRTVTYGPAKDQPAFELGGATWPVLTITY